MKKIERSKILLFAVLVIAIGMRSLVLIPALKTPEKIRSNDTPLYFKLATNLLKGNGFSSCSQTPFYPDTVRTPVYPLFLATLFYLFGQSYEAVALAQVLIDIFTGIIIFFTGRKLFNPSIAFFAALFYAMGITNIPYTVIAIAETFLTFLLSVNIYFLVAYIKTYKVKYLIVGQLFWGLAVLCKPVVMFSLPIIVLLIFFSNKEKWKKGMMHNLVLVMVSSILVAPWIIRNKSITGQATISTVVEHDLLLYNAVHLKTYIEGRPGEEIAKELLHVGKDPRGTIASCTNDYSDLAFYKSKAYEIIKLNLPTYIYLHLKADLNNLIPGVTKTLEIYGLTEGNKGTVAVLANQGIFSAIDHYFGNNKKLILYFIPWILFHIFFLLFTLVGAILLFKEKMFSELILLLFIGVYFVLIPGPMSAPRFFIPAVPFFSILAGIGFYFRPFFKRKRNATT